MKKEPEHINFDIDGQLLGRAQAVYEQWRAWKTEKQAERIPVTEVIESALHGMIGAMTKEMTGEEPEDLFDDPKQVQ